MTTQKKSGPKQGRTTSSQAIDVFNLFIALRLFRQDKGYTQEKLLELICGIDPEAERSPSTLGKQLDNPPKSVSKAFYNAVITLLEPEGFWPLGESPESIRRIFAPLAPFFRMRTGKLDSYLAPYYEYYQWSSRLPGKILISVMTVSPFDGENRFRHVFESQAVGKRLLNEEGMVGSYERYEGVAFERRSRVCFLMRETEQHFPKWCLFTNHTMTQNNVIDVLVGYTLKASDYGPRNWHQSPIYLHQVNSLEDCECRIEEPEKIDDRILANLKRRGKDD